MSAAELIQHALAGRGVNFRIVLECKEDMGAGEPAFAAVFGDPKDGCLVRVHSRCVYGEAFESEYCDCGPQLKTSLELIRAEGSGVVVYLDQEGRASGLAAKARGYMLTEKTGSDTFSSYIKQGLPADARSYGSAVYLLSELGLKKIRLLTANPYKIQELESAGIEVQVERLNVPVSEHAKRYLEAKKRAGFLL
jgi:GTP cyclohydrolase II